MYRIVSFQAIAAIITNPLLQRILQRLPGDLNYHPGHRTILKTCVFIYYYDMLFIFYRLFSSHIHMNATITALENE